MAFNARWQCFQAYIFPDVTLPDRVWLVVVAAVAGIFYVLVWMAGLASHLALLSVIEGKAVYLEFGWLPGGHGVAELALLPEISCVDFWLGMAAYTLGRSI